MLLSVIISAAPLGTARMLERELAGLDAEVIVKSWKKGIPQAKGDFVCLLEEDSAVGEDTIRGNLVIFTENPSYRKLAMVSCMVDFDNTRQLVHFGFDHGLKTYSELSCDDVHAVRVGYVPGAVIRHSSLLKSGLTLKDPMQSSIDLSLDFWAQGLRINLNPEALYYAPPNVKFESFKEEKVPAPEVTMLWQREMIT